MTFKKILARTALCVGIALALLGCGPAAPVSNPTGVLGETVQADAAPAAARDASNNSAGDSATVAAGDASDDDLSDVPLVTLLAPPPGPPRISFGPPVVFPTGSATTIALGDLSGDGLPDLVCGCSASTLDTFGLFVHMNDGQGGFPSATMYSERNSCGPIAIGDIDGDGHNDVIALRLALYRPNSHEPFLFANGGDGSLLERRAIRTDGDPILLQLGDINGDGHLDLGVVSVTDSGKQFELLLNDGDGTFSRAIRIPLVGAEDFLQVEGIAWADIDGDGRLEFVAYAIDHRSFIRISMDADGSARTVVDRKLGLIGSATLGQFDGLGGADALFVHSPINPADRRVLVACGGAEGVLTKCVKFPSDYLAFPRIVASADLDGDGDRDILCAGSSDIIAFSANLGFPSFGRGDILRTTSSNSQLLLTDVTGDRLPDIVSLDSSARVMVLTNTTR